MKPQDVAKTRYAVKESYRQQAFVGVINKDSATYSWTWKGRIDFEDGPYSEFKSERNFPTMSDAEEHFRRFVHQRIDQWLNISRPDGI